MHTVGRSVTKTAKKIILALKEKKNYVHEIKDDSAWNISWNTLPFSLTFSAKKKLQGKKKEEMTKGSGGRMKSVMPGSQL